MAETVRSNPFNTGLGAPLARLGSRLFGYDDNEGRRLQATAYAENARANIDLTNERTLRAQRSAAALARIGERLPNARTPADIAGLAQDFAQLDEDGVRAVRGAIGTRIGMDPALFDPRITASWVGATGGNAGHTLYGVEEGERTRRRGQDVAAGATIEAERLRQRGQTDRLRLTPPNPGTDGLYLTPAQREFYGMPPDPGTGPLPAGVQGPTLPPAYRETIFLPGAANVSPGGTRVSPLPGIVDPNNPTVTQTTAPDRSAAGVSASIANQWARGDLPEEVRQRLEAAGVRLGDLLMPGVATQRARNDGTAQVATIRADAAQNVARTQADARIDAVNTQVRGALANTQLRGDQRADLQRIIDEGAGARASALQAHQIALQGARDDATRERLEMQLAERLAQIALQGEQRLAQIAAQGTNALNVQASRNDGSLAVANATGQSRLDAARARNSGRPPRALTNAETQSLADALDGTSRLQNGGRLSPDARAMVAELAGELMRENGLPAEAAVSRAISELRGDNTLRLNSGWFSNSLELAPGAPARPAPARPGAGVGDRVAPAAPAAPAAAPTAPQAAAAPVLVRTPAEAQALEPGTVYVTPDGRRFTR